MHAAVASMLAGLSLWGADPAPAKAVAMNKSSEAAAATYEQLATAIISIRATEDSLVAQILAGYRAAANSALHAAEMDSKARASLLETAAGEVTNIANEGDKRVQAVRQRLAKAGHTHNSDADTKEDYMFVDSKEKKALLAVAKKIAQLGAQATSAQIAAVQKEFDELAEKSLASK